MVTCDKCGAENNEDAKYCNGCGAVLGQIEIRKKKEDECFGLPHGGAIFGLFIGVIIILWGVTEVFDLQIDLGSYAIIIIGILILAGAIYGLTRRR